MADTAAHLVDRVFPHVPVRQWVLSFPHALRYRLAYDSHLITDVLDIFIKTVFASLIRRAAEFGAVRKPQCGAVSFIQRFGSALDLNVHIHAILLDGIYAADDEGRPHFQALLSPDNEEVARVTASLAEAITDFLRRRGLGPESDREESDSLSRDQPWLAGLYAASVLGRTAFGPNAGRRTTRTGDQIDPESMDAFASPRCANVNGFSLHANVALNSADRKRLERLIRYCARPPVAVERLEGLPDGRVLYRLKRPWRNGATHVVFQPQELLEKLAALVPAPRAHSVRYSGVFAPAAVWRPLIVPDAAATTTAADHDESPPPIDKLSLTPDAPVMACVAVPPETSAISEGHGRNYYLPFPTMSRDGGSYSGSKWNRRQESE